MRAQGPSFVCRKGRGCAPKGLLARTGRVVGARPRASLCVAESPSVPAERPPCAYKEASQWAPKPVPARDQLSLVASCGTRSSRSPSWSRVVGLFTDERGHRWGHDIVHEGVGQASGSCAPSSAPGVGRADPGCRQLVVHRIGVGAAAGRAGHCAVAIRVVVGEILAAIGRTFETIQSTCCSCVMSCQGVAGGCTPSGSRALAVPC